jgi:beta-N-acetylhexosaminidase
VVLTDDLEMHAIIDHYGIEDAAVRAVLAGCDVLLICKDRDREVAAFQAVEQAVEAGTISAERLNQSVARITRLKDQFIAPYKPVNVSDAKLVAGCQTHRSLLHSIEQVQARLSLQKYS